jgi:hypothetical protein
VFISLSCHLPFSFLFHFFRYSLFPFSFLLSLQFN